MLATPSNSPEDDKQRWAISAFKRILYRCKHQGLEFDLQLPDLRTPDLCPLTCLPLDYENASLGLRYRDVTRPFLSSASPCVCRKDHSLGFTRLNCFTASLSWTSRQGATPLSAFLSVYNQAKLLPQGVTAERLFLLVREV